MNALLLQGILATAFIIPGNFGSLVEFFGFASWFFYASAATALIVLRRRHPVLPPLVGRPFTEQELPRPYKVHGYPVVPVLFIVVAGWLVVNSVMEAPKESSLAAVRRPNELQPDARAVVHWNGVIRSCRRSCIKQRRVPAFYLARFLRKREMQKLKEMSAISQVQAT